MKKIISLTALLLAFSLSAADFPTNYFTVDVAGRSVAIDHREVSAATGFDNIGKEISMMTYSLRAGLAKEFEADKLISFTIGAGGGVLRGRDKGKVNDKNLEYRDEVRGHFYGGGVSINTNFSVQKLRAQVFAGLNFQKNKLDYKLSHTPVGSTTPSVNTDYSEDGTQTFLTGGMRFFDHDLGLFSTFALDYEVASNFSRTSSVAKVNKANVTFTNPASIDHRPIVFSIGFGVMF